MCNDEQIAKKVDKGVFPGCQGGPLMHVIAAKAVCFKKALTDEFKSYARDVVKNTSAMADAIIDGGLRLVTGGSENHICLIDCRQSKATGSEVEDACAKANITFNKNAIPFDKLPPTVCSGIRIGAAPVTARGFSAEECYAVASEIAKVAFNVNDESVISHAAEVAKELLAKHPLYE